MEVKLAMMAGGKARGYALYFIKTLSFILFLLL